MTSAELFWFGMVSVGIIILIGGIISYYLGKESKVNPWIGFRLPSTLSSSEVWSWANKTGGFILITIGAVFLASLFIFRGTFLSNQLLLLFYGIDVVVLIVISTILLSYKVSHMAK